MRTLTYTNPLGASITFNQGSGLYGITKVTGLGVPELTISEKKSPYQNGTVPVSYLANPREVALEGVILTGHNNALTYQERRNITNVINPLLGPGTLVYTNDYVSRKMTCTPKGPIFADRLGNEGNQKFQITFHCYDPFLYHAPQTISLPTPVNSSENIINGASSLQQSVIQLANGNLFVVYVRSNDNYLVSQTYTTSWGEQSVINSAAVSTPSVIQLANGNLFVVYRRDSDGYLVSRTYTTGWGTQSVINSASSYTPSVIQLANGNLFVVYVRSSDNYLVSRTYTTSWGAESVINSASSNSPSVIQLANGNLFVVYVSSTQLISRTTIPAGWGTQSVINSAAASTPSVIQLANGNLFVVYRRDSDGYFVSRTYAISWSTESVVNSTPPVYYENVILLDNGNLFFVYTRASDNYFVSVTRSVTPVTASNTGQYNTPISVTLNGPSVNPRIVNKGTLQQIRLNKTLATGDYFTVNTAFGNKTIVLVEGGIVKNGLSYLDTSSALFYLAIGNNTVYYEDDAVSSTATATMTFTNRDIGI